MIQVNLVIRHDAKQFFFETAWIGKVDLRAGSHVAADHNAVDRLRRVGHGDVNDQYLLAILAQDVPDRLATFAVCLHPRLTSTIPRLLLVFPEVIHAVHRRLHTGRERYPCRGSEWRILGLENGLTTLLGQFAKVRQFTTLDHWMENTKRQTINPQNYSAHHILLYYFLPRRSFLRSVLTTIWSSGPILNRIKQPV